LSVPAAPASVHALPVNKKGNGAVIALVVGGLVALGAAAAGGLLFSNAHKTTDAVTTTGPVAVAPTHTTAQQPSPASPAAEAAHAAEPTMDPNALPAAAPNEKLAAVPKAASPVKATPPAKPVAQPPAAQADAPVKLTEKDLAPPPSGPAGDLGAAIKKEVGDEPAKTPAAATTSGNAPSGNVPQKPSQGAVTGAIGAVLPQARACLGPDDPISRASIVFSSAGSVQSVSVSGGATGKPAEACIKDALTKAKLQPFAEPSYTANITIRHN
jgi:hypothetical protein